MIDRRTFLLTPLALAAAELKPNVVLMVASQWRAQATPWGGDPGVSALHLEKFGKEAVVFSRAYSACPTQPGARIALFTGRFPHAQAGQDVRATLESSGYEVGRVGNTAAAVEFLGKRTDRPFFLTVNWEMAPPPKKVPDPERMHARDNVSLADEARVRRDLAQYYAKGTALDEEIGRILDAVERWGSTIVAFTSDRGIQIGSHGLEGDDVAFEESERVPLAIRIPGVRARASDLLISQVDIVPTLLGLCGEGPAEGAQGLDLSAFVISSTSNGEKAPRRESVFAEGKLGQKDEWRMVLVGFDKLVVNAQSEPTHLYNLADDPYELINRVREPGMQLKRDGLLAALRASMSTLGDFKKRQ